MSTDRTDNTSVAEVVVGVDGSEPSTRALIWALDMARSHGWSVDVITAWPDAGSVLVHEVPGHFSLPRHRADEAQRTALTNALLTIDSPPVVETHLVNARPVTALRERAATAQVLVVGSHGDDRPSDHRRRTPIGEALKPLVPCPVVVVEPWEA